MNSSIDGENRVNTYNASKQQALAFHKRFLSSYLLLFTFIDNKNSEHDQEIPQSQPQTTLWHREEEPLNQPGRQMKQQALSSPSR